MLSVKRNELAGNIAGELHIGVQGPQGPAGETGPRGPAGPQGDSTTISLRYGISSEPMENTVVVWQDTIPQMSETYPYLWIEISTETKTSTGGSIVIEKGIIGYYSTPESTGSAGTLTVNVTTVNETEAQADKTFAEIQTAISENREVYVFLDGGDFALRLSQQNENAITFAWVGAYASDESADIQNIKVDFNADGTVFWEQGNTSVPSQSSMEYLYVMKPDTAQVGQTIVVDAVDEENRPVRWRAVNLPTDTHINSLIDTKLGVIENGSY